ncbi:MAG: ferrochelatase, partial [Caulobacteraceae bacterium]
VELDRDYAKRAAAAGVAPYIRVPALGTSPRFIEGLARLAERALASESPAPGGRACDGALGRCALRNLGLAA